MEKSENFTWLFRIKSPWVFNDLSSANLYVERCWWSEAAKLARSRPWCRPRYEEHRPASCSLHINHYLIPIFIFLSFVSFPIFTEFCFYLFLYLNQQEYRMIIYIK